ncbi:MAG: hypothetical protein F6K09_15725 [Merismopedia sp. SIO2A8]|nr:hypothetical protein [Symploca sp. SIO2B6]NET50132.1 hypothetical protein [Merismopedia sp. SIO2A8]
MTDPKTINDVRGEIEAIVTQLNQRRPLVYRSLRQIAEQQGWKEDMERGKGSHRSFRQAGYPSVTVKCHGEGKELDATVVRKALQELYQPTVDRILEAALEPALLEKIDDLLEQFNQATETIACETAMMGEDIREEALQSLAKAQQDIEQYSNTILEQELKAAKSLAKEQVNAQITGEIAGRQAAIAQASQIELNESRQQIEQLEQKLEQQVNITHRKQADLDRLNQTLNQAQEQVDGFKMREHRRRQDFQHLQEQNHDLAQNLAQVDRKQQSLTQDLQTVRTENHQLRRDVERFKRQQRWKDLSLWFGLGFALILAIAGIRALAIPTAAPLPPHPQSLFNDRGLTE